MVFRRDRTSMLARLRASTRLAVLVLLVAALKIGAVAACAQQDYADLRAGNAQGTLVQALGVGAGDLSEGSFTLAGMGSHCSCHQASALPTIPVVVLGPIPRESTADYRSGTPPSTYPRLELRPPIA